jgi:hypothetical protein
MRIVYFDANIFDHLHKRINVTDSDIARLRSAVNKGSICIPLSIISLEETVSALESSPDVAMAEMRLIDKLVDWRKVLEDPAVIIEQDMRRYAKGRGPASPFIADPEVIERLRRILRPTEESMHDILESIRESRQQKESFAATMSRRKEWYSRRFKQVGISRIRLEKGQPGFNQVWERHAPRFAEGLARQFGVLNACRKRGVRGLLDLRSVLLTVGANLYLVYTQNFEGRKPNMGDSRDARHATSACIADIFVTDDIRLARMLERIPIKDFQVLNLREFMNQVRWMV